MESSTFNQGGITLPTTQSHHRSRWTPRPYKMTPHHRRPKSRGGRTTKENIVWVFLWQHTAWHRLFDNFNVPTMFERFKYFYNTFSGNELHLELQGTLPSYRHSSLIRKKAAWVGLFDSMTLEEIVSYLFKGVCPPQSSSFFR